MVQAGKRVGLFVTCLVDFIRPSIGFAAAKRRHAKSERFCVSQYLLPSR